MAGMAEAEAAQWLVVRLRGVLYTAEAHSSGVGHSLRGAHSGLLVCSASVCEK